MLCWSLNPYERPNFKQIVKKLDEDFNFKDYKIEKNNSQALTIKPELIKPNYHHNSTSSKCTSSRISSSSYSESDFDSQNPKFITTSHDEADDAYFDDNNEVIETNSMLKLTEELKPFLNHYNNINHDNFIKEIEKNQYSML